ncbi:hypothetical protein HID58_069862 [Brassica napus]|uniref:AAA+ ATPase domain-containing protein n=1 Tax=Brassica napus TaxID=3708 RepID=A0ABQ7YX47_BRANA|nr:hypothetical protein HID58_069862 [Brassica napus]
MCLISHMTRTMRSSSRQHTLRRKLTDSRAGIFEAFDFNYQKLADFGAGISDANKHKIQEVLEELDVHKLLDLTLQLVKKQVEINKIKKFHASAFPESTAETDEDKKESTSKTDEDKKLINSVLFSADTFRKRIEPIIEKIPKHVLKVIYLDWLTTLPWGKCSDENFDVLRAEAILDEDHYGLADIKERILEFIAVRTLTGNPEVKIICLSGPPGVGKTSIARSIARVLDRKFFRLAVGGLSDSSEIKGDRGVCVGAKPGKMVQCLKQVGTENPLVLLDEIDKIGKSSKYDPEGALLELLDPEQNAQFLDYFLDVPIDLSKILFVCTANDIDRLPDPLLDRMEVIKLAGYTTDEKMHIARDYLVKIVSGKCGIKPDQVDVSDTALLSLIENYCREAGVRNLQKHIENIFRKVPDPVGFEPSRESLVPEVDESAGTKKKGKKRPVPDASITVVQGGSSEIAAEVCQDEPPQKKKKKDKKKKPAEKDPVPSVGAENRELVVHEESSRVPPVLPSSDPGSAPLGASSIVDEEAPAREVGPGDADPVLPAEGRETRPGLDDLVELSDSLIERSGQNESSDGTPPGVGEDLNASSGERGERGSEDAIAQVPEEPESRSLEADPPISDAGDRIQYLSVNMNQN